MPKAGVTAEELRLVLYFLDEPGLKRFIRIGLGLDWKPDAAVSALTSLQVLLADWLSQFDFVSDAQRQEVVRRVTPCLKRFGTDLEKVKDGKYPIFKLVIADYRWVSCTFRDEHYDLEEGEELTELPHAAVTYFACDLTASWLRALLRIGRLRKTRKVAHGSDGEEGGAGSA